MTHGNRLTDTELELMTIIWRLGEGTVKDVIDHLPEGRELAYTSVSTILRILEKKGVLVNRKDGRSHVYCPCFSKSEYEERSLQFLVEQVFDGEPVALMSRFIDTAGLKDADLKALRELIDRKVGRHEP